MPQENDISEFAFEALRIRITKVLPAQIRTAIEQLSEEQLWWRPNAQSNSVGNLVLHVCGAVLHFLCGRIGDLDYDRDRPAEFAAGSEMPKQELLAKFDEMVSQATQTFEALDANRLSAPSTEPSYYSTVFEDLFGITVHMAVHTGQIVYVAKMLKEGSIDDLWTQTHRNLGAWKAK